MTGSEAAEVLMFIAPNGDELLADAFQRCTATTTRGSRCRNYVFVGQEWWSSPTDISSCVFSSDAARDRATHLLCPFHIARLRAVSA
jgi:hypothetical protein